MRKIFSAKFLYIFFTLQLIILLVWDAYLYTLPSHETLWNFWFNIYGSISILIALVGLFSVLLGKDRKGALSRSLIFISLGLLLNGLGLYYWGYNAIINNIAIPYPSIGEYLFLAFPILIGIGFWRMMGLFKPLITWRIVIEALVITIASSALIFNYFIIPNIDPSNSFFGNFVTVTIPWEDAFLIALVFVALRVSGGKFRSYFWLYIIGLLLLIAGDFTFQYRNAVGIYWNGDIADLIYVFNAYIFSLAIIATLEDSAQPSSTTGESMAVPSTSPSPTISTTTDTPTSPTTQPPTTV